MARDSQSSQSRFNNQENEKPPASKEDEEFVDIAHGDIAIQDPDADADSEKHPAHELELQRFGNNLEEVEDDDDESGEEHDHMAGHPLLSMLTGRLGQRQRGSPNKFDKLHPENQVLSVANVDECAALEAEAFPEEERCSREKFHYRLSRCPELSLGLFSQPTKAAAAESQPHSGRKLVAHVVATRTPAPSVTDASMGLPPDWKSNRSSLAAGGEAEALGHQETGGTVCIHSLAVAKKLQGLGLGTILLKAYVQRIKDSKCADRVALLAHDHLVGFYSNCGFENMGPSSVTLCGGGWNNMILEFGQEEDD